MFVILVTIAASVFAANQDAGPKDIYARLGVPKIEKCDFRIHVGKEGKWTTHLTQAYSIEGVTSEDLKIFEEMLIEEARDCGAKSVSCFGVGENRRQCVSKGKSNDSLKLASLLVHVFEEDKCDFVRLDRESFEWKFLRGDHHVSSSVALESILNAALDVMLLQKGVTRAELDSTEMDLVKCQLVLTTDGSITADAPAEVSEDGKTLTLDLSKFLSDPPEKWSIRIDGL